MRADAEKNYGHLLAVAGEVLREDGIDGASMRDIARKAKVGLATMLRHFPTREALLDALLRTALDELTARAASLAASAHAGDALVTWLRDAVAFVHVYSGAVDMMAAALADQESDLHASCVAVRSAGSELLATAQAQGDARSDIDGEDLFALTASLGWLHDQPALSARADRIFDMVAQAVLAKGT
ncbi:TetR/AcrR family transcriptional regulator [Rhizobium halophytocola]|uniref:AcrR family transcriptional regulator n=1 Tax=Rhizobium halophytocola TaxID=735519 RepID=A0ABS4DSN8_9HYPH|nr:TetR/AcrR family transcriptional regulator [Rhizobium halophytocola]MBP1848706.1 AcrR family transcriptional regulator [Rhizobium halophytocola]